MLCPAMDTHGGQRPCRDDVAGGRTRPGTAQAAPRARQLLTSSGGDDEADYAHGGGTVSGVGRAAGDPTRGRRRRGSGRTMGAFAVAALLALGAGCDREEAPAYGGDPEGRIVTAGRTADELVTRGETARRIAEVRLSGGLVERWFAAQERLDELAASDDDVRRLLDEGDGDGAAGEDADDAIDAATRRLERDSRVHLTIQEAGLTPREYVLTALALHQALLASSPGAPRELRSIAARNVRFVDRNAALLEQLSAPRPPRVLAYGDTVQYVGPFVDTLTPYDQAPYDAYRDPSYAYPDSVALSIDTMPLPPVGPPIPDTAPPPPVVVPPEAPPGSARITPVVPPVVPPVVSPSPPARRGDSGGTASPSRSRPDSARDTLARRPRAETLPPPPDSP